MASCVGNGKQFVEYCGCRPLMPGSRVVAVREELVTWNSLVSVYPLVISRVASPSIKHWNGRISTVKPFLDNYSILAIVSRNGSFKRNRQ
jgi:hypothetical protein